MNFWRGAIATIMVTVASVTVTFIWAAVPVKGTKDMWQPIVETNKTTRIIPTYPSAVDFIKDEIHATKNWDEDREDVNAGISYDEAWILMKVAQAEAEIDGIEGMAAVMQVVKNRVESSEFPDTIEDVVMQSAKLKDGRTMYHFSTVDIGTYFDATPTMLTHLALAEFEKGTYDWLDALYFGSEDDSWQAKNREYICTIGHHKFYR